MCIAEISTQCKQLTHLCLCVLPDLLLQVTHIYFQFGALRVLLGPLGSRLLPLLFQVCQIGLCMPSLLMVMTIFASRQ